MRKLGKPTPQRIALLRNQVTNLIHHEKIVTTEARAKEVRRIAERLITLAVKEKDNFETVKVKVKVPQRDKDGKRVKQIVDRETGAVLHESHRNADGTLIREEKGKTKTVFTEEEREIKKDLPSRLAARRKMLSVLYPVTEYALDENGKIENSGKKKNSKKIDLPKKLFDEIAPRYAERKGGYTRIIKLGQRRGDGALEVILELV